MIKASLEDKSLVADILTTVFLHNKSVNYLIPQDGLKMFRIHEQVQYSFEICRLFGEVFFATLQGMCFASLSINSSDTPTSKSMQLDYAVPAAKNCGAFLW